MAILGQCLQSIKNMLKDLTTWGSGYMTIWVENVTVCEASDREYQSAADTERIIGLLHSTI